jgi:hypothetical protein
MAATDQLDTFDQLKLWLSSKGIQVDNILDIISEEQSMNPANFSHRCNFLSPLTI